MAVGIHRNDELTTWVPTVWPVLAVEQGEVTAEGAEHVEDSGAGFVFHRLPPVALRSIYMEFFRVVESQPSGVRLVMRTRATTIELVVSTTAAVFFPDEPVESFGRFDLLIDGELHSRSVVRSGGVRTMDPMNNSSTVREGDTVPVVFADLPERDKVVEIWLPHDVEVTVKSLRADAPLSASRSAGRNWVHYGSSISHGVNAEAPTGTWCAVAAAQTGATLMNLGFSGNALLDSYVAASIRDRDADIISLEIGINVINHDGFRVRTFLSAVTAFLDTIRERHTTTPIWVVSAMLCPVVEDRPGPTMMVGPPGARRVETEGQPHDVQRGRLSLALTRELLQQIVEMRSRTDSNLHYLDGRELYGEAESESMPMRDGLHPDSAAQRHIGVRFAELVLSAAVTGATRARKST